jgi:hypothetical protein
MQARNCTTLPALSRALSRPLQALRKAGSYLADELTGSYRPEKHYMRGPGPKWREKAAGSVVQGGPHATPSR